MVEGVRQRHLIFRLALTYEIQLDKDKNQADKRLLFRESFQSSKRRQLRLVDRVCHDYSLYMKVRRAIEARLMNHRSAVYVG